MPVDMPEDSSNASKKKWKYRKPGATSDEESVEVPEKIDADSSEELVEEPVAESTFEVDEGSELEPPEEDNEMSSEETEVPVEKPVIEDAIDETEEDTVQSPEVEKVKMEDQATSKQIEALRSEVEEINTKKNALEEQIATLTEKLDQANTDNAERQEQIAELQSELKTITESEKEKTKKLKTMQGNLSEAEEKISHLKKEQKTMVKTAKEREEHLLTQLEALAEQVGKLREVIRKRDDELVALQKDILVKKDLAQGAQEEASQLRTVGIVQREAVQDTTVLRRRVNDLEVELEQLKKALEKDPKYRIYMLVRETGQRTLEELSKILGVGVYETRRRVQELVRAGLLESQGEVVKISRRA
jgi:chromosome segregation ATPase